MSPTSLDKPKSPNDRAASRNPRSNSFTQDLIRGLRVWAHHTFSVTSLLSGLKSLLWVAPLSVVIWIYAEQDDVGPDTATATISVHSANPSRVVRLLDPPDGRITFIITGANNNRQHTREQLAALSSLQIDVPESILTTTGYHQLSGALINDMDVFRTNGIVVSKVPDLTVTVDELRDVDVEVQAAPLEGKNLVAPPVFTPRRVHVKAPSSLIPTSRAKLVAYAHLDETGEALTPGPHDLPAVPLTVAFGDKDTRITPLTVAAHFEVKNSDATGQVPAMPVWAIYPPTIEDKYKAVYDPQVLPSVTVTGPEELVNKLVNNTYTPAPKATFEVSPDLSGVGAEQTVRLQFDLPPDVHVSPEFAQKRVTYHLVERRAGE